MGKIKYLCGRIFSMHFDKMFEKIDDIHKKTGKSKIYLFFDMINCGLKYQAGYMDYWLFEMYDLNRAQRKTVVTRGINNAFIKRFNDPAYMKYIDDKLEFNRRFEKFLKRDWLDVHTATDEQLAAFCEKHSTFMAKPENGMCGKGIQKLNFSDFDSVEELRKHLVEANLMLLEEPVVQHPDLMRLHPNSVNTCRVITIAKDGKTRVVAAYLRIGNGKYVDNFNSGGMVVPIEEDRGEIIYPALDKSGNLYEKHPMTGVSIKGFKIPLWDEVIKLVCEAGQVVPQVGLVGWDVCVTEKGPLLIEGNEFPGHDIYQLPPHRTNGIGVLPKFKRAIDGE